jgi:hypothetical protein
MSRWRYIYLLPTGPGESHLFFDPTLSRASPPVFLIDVGTINPPLGAEDHEARMIPASHYISHRYQVLGHHVSIIMRRRALARLMQGEA